MKISRIRFFGFFIFLFILASNSFSQLPTPTPTPVQYPNVPNDGHDPCAASGNGTCPMIGVDDVEVYRRRDHTPELYFVRANDISSSPGGVYIYSQSLLLGTMWESSCFCSPSPSTHEVIAYANNINPSSAGVDIGTYYQAFFAPEKTFVSSLATIAIFTFPNDDAENAGQSCAVGQPVNMTNGNMWINHSDYKLPSLGESIEINRFYNSIIQTSGLFGYGWTTKYDESLGIYGDKMLRLNMPDGRAFYFGRKNNFEAFTPISSQFYGFTLKNADNTYTLAFKDGTVHEFNAGGRLLKQKDRNGNQTTLSYDTNANLIGITDAFNRTLTITPNSNGTIAQISDNLGNQPTVVATYEYFPNTTLLKTVTYADSSKYKFEYITINNKTYLQTVKDALDNILETHEYDSSGRATTSEKQGGVEKYTLDYTHANDTLPYTTVTDALSRVTKFYFDKSKGRNVITKTEGLCNCGGNSQIMQYEYDNNLNKTKKIDGNGNITTMTYDSNGNMLTETDITGTKTYTYDNFGQILTYKDQIDFQTQNNTAEITYNSNGNPTQVKDALGKITNFTYNSQGQILTVTDARGKTTTYTWTNANLTKIKDANLKETNFVYDSRSRLTSTTNALSFTTNYQYDLANRLKKIIYHDTNFEEFTYDLAGRRTQAKDARGNITNYGYDSAYRLTSITDALTHPTSFVYDLMSNRTSITDAEGKVTNYEYDDFNRLKKVIYPEITVGGLRLNEQYQYDQVGNLKKKIDTASRETLYDYDGANRLFKTTDALTNITQFYYNQRSQMIKVKDALNQDYEFSYDALGRQLSQTRAGNTMTFEYDEVGNRIKRTDYIGRETTYEYDNLNRLHKIKYLNGTNNPTPFNISTYSYDDISRLMSAVNENGTVNFTYDSRNRISSTTDVFGHLISYGYDANGNRNAMTLDGQPHANYQYDAVNRLTQLTDEANQNFTFGYDVVNRLVTKSLPNNVVTSYNYDGMNRLTQLKHQGTATLMDDNYSYNTANQISNIAGLSQTRNFGYDNVDKLTSVTGSTAENFMYDAVGNRTSSSQSASYTYQPYNRLTSTATATYTYNANGSMTGKSEGSTLWRYGYDYENRLVEASTRKQTVRYRYDALGRRIQRYFIKGGKDNTKFTYDGQDVVLDNNDGVITKYQNGLGIDNKLKLTTNGTSKYFLQDHLGSTTGLTNSSGNITESTSYDSFGNASGTLSTRYSYTGREYDNFTGLYYYRARFYDAKLGRFISEDPRGFFGSYDFNNYNYCLNNPLIYRDFTGESPTLVTGAIGAGVGAIIGGSFALVSGGSWGDVAKGAAVGAVAGGVTGLTLGLAGPAIASAGGGGIIGGMIAGGVSSGAGNLAGQGLSYGLGWRCDLSPKEFGLSVGLGAAGGGFLLRPGTLPNQPVTSWASKGVPPDLNPGRWVMTGGNTLRNYGMSGTSSYAPYGNSITGNIPSSNLAYPAGWEGFKGLFGQRVIGQ